jgi:hypothetical protein
MLQVVHTLKNNIKTKNIQMGNKTTRTLNIRHNNGHIIVGEIEYFIFGYDQECTLEFNSSLTEKLMFTESDFFECLIMLREELDRFSYYPLCNGARIDVYPSGMCRDMGNGLCAYIHAPNKQVDMEDLVDIFDYANPDLIASVDEQRKFYRSLINRGIK